MLRRYIAYRPSEAERIYRMLAAISTGVKGHGPIHLLLSSAAKIGLVWNSDSCSWTRPGWDLCTSFPVPGSFLNLPSCRLGKTVYLLTSVKGRVFGVFRKVFLCLTGRAL